MHWPCWGPALETRLSHTIEYGVTRIILQRCWQGKKSRAVLLGSSVRRCISVPMCDCSTTCNTPAHTARVENHKEGVLGFTWPCTAYIILPQIDHVQGHTQTHPQLRDWHHWLHGPAVYCVYWLWSTTLQDSTLKQTGSISQESIYHLILDEISLRYQTFDQLLGKLSEDASQKSSLE